MGDDFADLIILPPAITYNEHHPEHTDSPPDHLKNIDHNYFNKIDQNDLLELSVVHPISTNENTNKKLPVLCAQNAASDDSKRKNQQKDVTRESSKSKAESDDFLVTSSEAAEVLNMIKTNVNGYSDDKVKIALSNKGLWTKFQNVQTEMIVTKSGRFVDWIVSIWPKFWRKRFSEKLSSKNKASYLIEWKEFQQNYSKTSP